MPERLPIDDLDDRLRPIMGSVCKLEVERWRFSDDELIIEEGDRARELFVLEDGTVRVERAASGGGDSRYLAMVSAEPGRVHAFGEMSFFLEGARTATVRSVGGSVVLKVREGGIPLLFHCFPELVRDLFAGVVDKLRQTTAELRGLQDRFDLAAEQRFVTPETSRLYEAGEVPGHLFRVVSGQVTLADVDGRTSVVRPSDRDGFVNATEFLARRPAAHRADAAPGTILVVHPRSAELAVVRSFPELVVGLLGGGGA